MNFNLPDSQKHLHTKISGMPDSSRIYSWKRELEEKDIRLFESVAVRTLKKEGYDPYSSYTQYFSKWWIAGLRLFYILKRVIKRVKLLCVGLTSFLLWRSFVNYRSFLFYHRLRGNGPQ